MGQSIDAWNDAIFTFLNDWYYPASVENIAANIGEFSETAQIFSTVVQIINRYTSLTEVNNTEWTGTDTLAKYFLPKYLIAKK